MHLDLRVFGSPSCTFHIFPIVFAVVRQTLKWFCFVTILDDTLLFDNAGLCYILTIADLKKKISLWFLLIVLFAIGESSFCLLIGFLVVITLGLEAADLSCLLPVEDLKKGSIASFVMFVQESFCRANLEDHPPCVHALHVAHLHI